MQEDRSSGIIKKQERERLRAKPSQGTRVSSANEKAPQAKGGEKFFWGEVNEHPATASNAALLRATVEEGEKSNSFQVEERHKA